MSRASRPNLTVIVEARKLICVECGRLDPGDEPGWTLRLDIDDEPVAFCPECDRKEFSGG